MRVLAVLLALASPACAQDGWVPVPGLRAADVPRWVDQDAALGRALGEALAGGAPGDVAALVAAMSGEPGPLDPAGEWSCRVLKLGGLLPLTAYPPFRCVVEPAGDGWRIKKVTGSQRLAGDIAPDGTYLGVGYVEGGPGASYATLPVDDQTPVEPGQTHAQVGRLEQPAPDRMRLLLPSPLFESLYDVLALTR